MTKLEQIKDNFTPYVQMPSERYHDVLWLIARVCKRAEVQRVLKKFWEWK